MTTYTIIEAYNLQSTRDGVDVELNDISAAKRYATKNQCFQNTALIIEVSGVRVAVKENGYNKKWINV